MTKSTLINLNATNDNLLLNTNDTTNNSNVNISTTTSSTTNTNNTPTQIDLNNLSSYHYCAARIRRLHDEIILFTRYIEPRPEEFMMRNEVVEKIKKVIKNEWPNSQVKVKF